MIKALPLCLSFSLNLCLFSSLLIPLQAQIDADASAKTRALYENLKQVQNSSKFMFGQEFFNSFRYNSGSAHGEATYSDSKQVTGSHPAVLGSDFHYYLDKSATERSFHTEALKYAYQQGAVITFDWHLSSRGTSTYEYQEATKNLVNNIVQDLNGDREWYIGELDKAIEIVNSDLVVDGERIPIVFRPLHEMNGGWFWWGSRSTNTENYIALYRLTVDYFKEKTNSVLYCWSPNTPVNMAYYPGDDYVDILGLDAYEIEAAGFRSQIGTIVDYSQSNGKVAVFAETGNRTNEGTSPGDLAARYWKDTILPAIVDDPSGKAQKIAWALTWINSSWSFPYVPHGSSSQTAKQSFIDFKNSPHTLFLDDLPNMYIENEWEEEEIVLSVGEEAFATGIQIYPNPANEFLTIKLMNAQSTSIISIHDLNGKILFEHTAAGQETIIPVANMLKSGIYLLKISDSKQNIIKKIIVNNH